MLTVMVVETADVLRQVTGRFAQRRCVFGLRRCDHGLEQVLLAPEVAVDTFLVRSRHARDAIHPSTGDAVRGELVARGSEQPVARCGPSSGVDGHTASIPTKSTNWLA